MEPDLNLFEQVGKPVWIIEKFVTHPSHWMTAYYHPETMGFDQHDINAMKEMLTQVRVWHPEVSYRLIQKMTIQKVLDV